jgi:DNA-binding SARP family transcriptional activator/tetratricopeptide (TPR) repeat protein
VPAVSIGGYEVTRGDQQTGDLAAGTTAFRILGSLECIAGGSRLRLGGPVPERVLAMLLLEAGQVVPVTRLVAAVWDDDPPATAAHQVRKAVAELRRRLPGGRDLIATDGPGYRAGVHPEQVDVLQFLAGLAEARKLAGTDPAGALARLRKALALWRGPVLAGAGGATIAAASVVLEERRASATEQLVELRLALGESGELLADLRDYVARNPLREVLHGQLMLALFRAGRQVEALDEYHRVRTLLADELGIDPSGQLSTLYERILRHDPALAAPAEAGPRTGTGTGTAVVRGEPAVPGAPGEHHCTLPGDLRDFTGRERELDRLLRVADSATGTVPALLVINGMGGSGKTSLAVRTAHRLADRFPDAHLYIDLRGFTPGETPLPAASAMELLLRQMGVPGESIPDHAAGRGTMWRGVLNRKRSIVVLDNARDAAQVRPLLPAYSQTLIVITTRVPMAELDGAHWETLGMMPPEDSAQLVTRALGADRARAEPTAVAELAELCGHLPLALRIASARLRKRPQWTVRYLVERLRDETYRLDELSVGERSVAATLRLSYEGLNPADRTAFRLLGHHPGTDVDPWAAAALLGAAVRSSETTLEHLLDVNLLQQHDAGRYIFHDLVRNFARGLSGPQTADEDGPAVIRLVAYYEAATALVCDLLFPGASPPPASPRPPASEVPPLHGAADADAWFSRELEGLLATAELAARHRLDRMVVLLARNLAAPLSSRGRFEELRAMGQAAVSAARRLNDPHLLRLSLSNLSAAHWRLGQFGDGIEAATEALRLAEQLGDRTGEAADTGQLGLLHAALGQFDKALPLLETSIALKAAAGAHRDEAETLTGLSTVYEQLGKYSEAAARAARAARTFHDLGAEDREAEALTDQALAELRRGRTEESLRLLDCARRLHTATTSPGEVALTLVLGAEVHELLGNREQAVKHAESGLRIGETSCGPLQRAIVENIVARLRLGRGEKDSALELHRLAHRTAAGAGYLIEEARALQGMASAAAASGKADLAEEYQRRADALFDTMGVAPAVRVPMS